MRGLLRYISVVLAVLVVVLAASAARAATIVVNNAADLVSNNGNCTLREAIQAANTNAKVDTCVAGTASDIIELPMGYFELGGHDLSLTGHVAFYGQGYLGTTIEFTGSFAQVVTAEGINVEFQFLTMIGAGMVVSEGSNVNLNYSRLWDAPTSVYVRRSASLAIFRSEVAGCYSPFGAVLNEGSLIVRNSTFHGNYGDLAGAITMYAGSLIISDSTIAQNESTGFPWNEAPDVLFGASALLALGGTTTITGSTIAHNVAHNMNGTCDANTCGGITTDLGVVRVKASVVAENETIFTAQDYDCADGFLPITSQGYNLLGSSASAGCPKTATDLTPQLPQFTSNSVDYFGGAGFGYLPKPSSPLVNAIPTSNATCSGATRDQRGVKRGKFGGCEPGAIERASAIFVVDNPASLNAGDQATKTIIEQLGFATTTVDDDLVSAATASGIHLVVISEGVTSTKINTKLRSIQSGVLVLEPSLFDDMSMTGPNEGTDFGNVANQNRVKIKVGSVVARTLGLHGTLASSLTSTTSNQSFGWGVAAASATVHSTINEASSTRATFFEYGTGVALKDASAAQGHRVGFFAFPGVVASLTTESASNDRGSGKGLMRQAILAAAAD